MSIVQTINLNLIPNSEPILVKCDQYDVGEGRIVAKLYDGDMAYTPGSGATAIIQGKKPDGHGFMYDATLSGNTVTADLTNQMSVVAGRVFVQFVITESDNRTGTFVFFLDVQPSALPADTEMSTSEYQVIEELLETAQAINENFPYIGANGHWFYYDVEQGQYVDSGVAAGTSITIGTTATLDAGDDATVTNSGDNVNAVFNFGIPRGPKGDQGTPGATGPQGPQGPQGEQGEKGDTGNTGATPNITMSATADGTSSATPTVNVSKTGTAENPNFALAFSGLKGNQGEQGPQGETGATGATGNGIVSITKTGTVGLVDTYTILFTNGQTTTFTVTNGQDGQGAGDMTKAVYDPNNDVANAGGIPAYIGAYDFDAYLKMYKGTPITGADLDSLVEVGTYIKTATGLKANSPADLVADDKYILAVMNAADNKNLTTEETLAGLQLLIAHINATNEIKVYLRGYTGTTGSFILTPHWTEWKSLDSPDVSGKADKVSGATSGDLAGLDANGNLTDSGSKASDFATASSVTAIEGKIPSTASSSNKMATASDIAGQETLLKDTVGWTGKNKLHATNAAVTTYNSTITENSDGTISKSGTVSGGNAQYSFAVPTNADYEFPAELKAGKEYVLSGCPSGGSGNTYELYIQFRNADNTSWAEAYHDYGEGVKFTATANRFSVYCRIFNGNADTLLYKPMIRLATISDDTYEPYHESVDGVITDVYEVMGENGAKNLVKTTTNTTTVGGLTFTRNSDGTYTIGAGTANADIRFNLNTTQDMIDCLKAYKGKNVKLSGSPAECDVAYNHMAFTGLETDGIGINDIGRGNTATISNSIETFSNVFIRIWVKSGTVIPTDRTFKPMITLAEDTLSDYDHYQPYVMTNRELTEVEDITSQFTVVPQSYYSFDQIKFAKNGKILIIVGIIKDDGITESPLGKTYKTVYTGLPSMVTDLWATIPSASSQANNPIHIKIQNNSMQIRGGTQNDYYYFEVVGMLK